MQATIENPVQSTAIRTDLGAIFVSLELSRSGFGRNITEKAHLAGPLAICDRH